MRRPVLSWRRALPLGAALLAAVLIGGPAGSAAATDPDPKIVGGAPASVNEYPWFASLQVTSSAGTPFSRHFCGGSLVNRSWVLTAAHCVVNRSPVNTDVIIGRTTLTNTAQGEFRDIAEIRIHPQYNASTSEYDAALLRLATPSTKTPIRLVEGSQSSVVQPGDTSWAIGYGRTTEGGVGSNNLLEVSLPIQSDGTMSLAGVYGTAFKPVTMIGAGPLAGGKDTCQGDSGGPLLTAALGGHRLIGATSWGFGCARPNKPGVYAELWNGPIRTWIEQQLPRAVFGYVWANLPTSAAYVPATAYQRNSTGAVNSVRRTGVGAYTVYYTNLGNGIIGGTVDVTAYGTASNACRVLGWGPSGIYQTVSVRCTNTAGAPADTRFTALYTRPVANSGAFAYLWYSGASAPSPYRFNSTGALNSVTPISTGYYRANLPGMPLTTGSVKVTAYGFSANRCKVVAWNGSGVYIRCYNAAGALVNSPFTVTFTQRLPLYGVFGQEGHVWASSPSVAVGTCYVPPAAYRYNSSGGVNQVCHLGAGLYQVRLPALGASAGHVQVTAYGAGNAECSIVSWGPSGSEQRVGVRCVTTTGAPVNTYFTAQYTR